MISFTQVQSETVCIAAERYLNRKSTSDSQGIRDWIEALREDGDVLAYLKLINLLKLYQISEISLQDPFSDAFEEALILEELSRHTCVLRRVQVSLKEIDLDAFKTFIAALSAFEKIETFELRSQSLEGDILDALTILPIQALSIHCPEAEPYIADFIRQNKIVDALTIVDTSEEVQSIDQIMSALQSDCRLKVLDGFLVYRVI